MIRKSMAALVLFSAALFLFPLVAGAHVEIQPVTTSVNGTVNTTVKAENECGGSHYLTNVELDFPASPALTSATPSDVPGWTAAVVKGADGQSVSKITWTNTGKSTGDGVFPIELATIPAGTKAVDFKALDTCDNGEVTRWIEPGENSANPAPVLKITAVKATGTTTTTTASSSKSSDDSNTGLIVGIVIAVVVIGGGVAFLLTRRKSSAGS